MLAAGERALMGTRETALLYCLKSAAPAASRNTHAAM